MSQGAETTTKYAGMPRQEVADTITTKIDQWSEQLPADAVGAVRQLFGSFGASLKAGVTIEQIAQQLPDAEANELRELFDGVLYHLRGGTQAGR